MLSGKRKKNVLKFLAVIIVLFIIGRIIDGQINTPSKGTVINELSSSQDNSPANNIDLSPLTVSGMYASFNYPKAMTNVADAPSGPEVAVYSYKYKDIQTWDLAIEIIKVPGGDLNDNSAWKFRTSNPSIYQETDDTINGQPIRIMTDTSVGGFSKVAFLVSGDLQAMVSLTGDDADGTANLSTVFNMVLNSWQWKV